MNTGEFSLRRQGTSLPGDIVGPLQGAVVWERETDGHHRWGRVQSVLDPGDRPIGLVIRTEEPYNGETSRRIWILYEAGKIGFVYTHQGWSVISRGVLM